MKRYLILTVLALALAVGAACGQGGGNSTAVHTSPAAALTPQLVFNGQCRDGSWTSSVGSGTCSHHGGEWANHTICLRNDLTGYERWSSPVAANADGTCDTMMGAAPGYMPH